MLRISDQQLCRLLELDLEYRYSFEHAPWIALEAVRMLGPLSPWWLEAEALEKASMCDSRLVSRRDLVRARQPEAQFGQALVPCCIVAENHGDSDSDSADKGPSRLLRPALVLPVRWIRSQTDGLLPKALVNLAYRVRRLLRSDEFRLPWTFAGADQVDGRDLTVKADSGFMALAAALKALQASFRVGDVRLDPTVWITGAWDDESSHVREVDGISQKVKVMLSFGAKYIFVPAQNYYETCSVVRNAGGDPSCVKYFPLANRVDDALRPVLPLLRVPPGATDSFEWRKDFYGYVSKYGSREQKDEYYRNFLLKDVVENCRRQLPERLRAVSKDKPILVTMLSFNPELVFIANQVFLPSRLVLLTKSLQTAPWSNFASLLNKWRSEFGMDFKAVEFPADSPDEAMEQAHRLYLQLLQDEKKRPVVVDLTPGHKPATIGLLAASQDEVPTVFVYLRHEYDNVYRQPEPGTERYVTVEVDRWRRFRND